MKARPIVMTDESVRALRRGVKRQTRRLMNPQPTHEQRHEWRGKLVYEGEHRLWCWRNQTYENLWDMGICEHERAQLALLCPFGRPGDLLWVKETWGKGTRPCPRQGWRDGIEYRADETMGEELPLYPAPDGADLDKYEQGWRSPRFMPRWASRMTLRLLDVKVQLLHEITDKDAWEEGIEEWDGALDAAAICRAAKVMGCGFEDARAVYGALWEKMHHKQAPLASNPWLWCLTTEGAAPADGA